MRQTASAPSGELLARTRQIATDVTATHAADVDARSRFPAETLAAARDAQLLSAAVPSELGGGGAALSQLAEMVFVLAQACGSSAMVMAMHHIQVAMIARHGRGAPAFDAYLREVVDKQRLIASVTSEAGVGGDTRTSICAVQREQGRFTLVKDATTVSYGEHAEDLLITCRRAPDAAPSDQVAVLVRAGDYRLDHQGSWDAMGMRGTCSPAFRISCSGPESQILPGSFADSSAETMVPYSHILWSSVWAGIAADAVARAAAAVRAEARRTPGATPPTAVRLAETAVELQTLRGHVAATAADFDGLGDRRDPLATMGWALRLNHLKVGVSEAAPRVVHKALQIIGLQGYKNDSPLSVARHYRDVVSASLMVANDRILSKSASMLLVHKDE